MSSYLATPQLTPECLALIKHFEGCRLDAYHDAVGVPTIGYGHTGSVRRGASITPQEADELLRMDLNGAQADVLRCVKVPLNDNEYAALVSLAFNIGGTALARSRCIKLLNRGDRFGAASEFERFVKGHVNGRAVTLRGLELRRRAEKELFLRPPEQNIVQDGHTFLAGLAIPLPVARPANPATPASSISQVTVTPMRKLAARPVVAAVGLGGGAGAVPLLTNVSGDSVQNWIHNAWHSSGIANLVSTAQSWWGDWSGKLPHAADLKSSFDATSHWLVALPHGASVQAAAAQTAQFLQSHQTVAVVAGAACVFVFRSMLLGLARCLAG